MKSENVFRMTRVLPLLVSLPLLRMVASMLGSVTSLHNVVVVSLHRVASFIFLKIISFKKKSSQNNMFIL